MFAGQTITGASSSTTKTVNVHLAVFFPSLAVQVTVVVPREKTLPLLGLQVTTGVPQLSVAVGSVHVTACPHWLASVPTIMGMAGHPEIIGGWLSVTVT